MEACEAEFKKGQIVKDSDGNYFEVLKVAPDAVIDVQSVATKECFIIPMHELSVVEGLRPR